MYYYVLMCLYVYVCYFILYVYCLFNVMLEPVPKSCTENKFHQLGCVVIKIKIKNQNQLEYFLGAS